MAQGLQEAALGPREATLQPRDFEEATLRPGDCPYGLPSIPSIP